MADLVQVGGAKYRRAGDGWLVTGEARECAVGPKMCAMLDRIAELESAPLPPALPVVSVTDEMVERAARVDYEATVVGSQWQEAFEPLRQDIRTRMRSILTAALRPERGEGKPTTCTVCGELVAAVGGTRCEKHTEITGPWITTPQPPERAALTAASEAV